MNLIFECAGLVGGGGGNRKLRRSLTTAINYCRLQASQTNF